MNAGVTPWIPAKGSVGASGDLAPLAHMSLTLLGEGKARVRGGDWLPATEALRQVGLEPITRRRKRAGATQRHPCLDRFCPARSVRSRGSVRLRGRLRALTTEAALGSRRPFDARIHEVRGQRGQMMRRRCIATC